MSAKPTNWADLIDDDEPTVTVSVPVSTENSTVSNILHNIIVNEYKENGILAHMSKKNSYNIFFTKNIKYKMDSEDEIKNIFINIFNSIYKDISTYINDKIDINKLKIYFFIDDIDKIDKNKIIIYFINKELFSNFERMSFNNYGSISMFYIDLIQSRINYILYNVDNVQLQVNNDNLYKVYNEEKYNKSNNGEIYVTKRKEQINNEIFFIREKLFNLNEYLGDVHSDKRIERYIYRILALHYLYLDFHYFYNIKLLFFNNINLTDINNYDNYVKYDEKYKTIDKTKYKIFTIFPGIMYKNECIIKAHIEFLIY